MFAKGLTDTFIILQRSAMVQPPRISHVQGEVRPTKLARGPLAHQIEGLSAATIGWMGDWVILEGWLADRCTAVEIRARAEGHAQCASDAGE